MSSQRYYLSNVGQNYSANTHILIRKDGKRTSSSGSAEPTSKCLYEKKIKAERCKLPEKKHATFVSRSKLDSILHRGHFDCRRNTLPSTWHRRICFHEATTFGPQVETKIILHIVIYMYATTKAEKGAPYLPLCHDKVKMIVFSFRLRDKLSRHC